MKHQKNYQPIGMFVALAVIAVMFLVLSVVRESRHQAETRLGLTAPPPVNQNQLPPILVPSHSDYVLPESGILPTHPLYSLKMIRDRVRLIITQDNSARATLLLEYADKRIAAAETLAFMGSLDESLTVATKAEAYLFQAVVKTSELPLAIQSERFDKLKQAVLKHEEIIEKIDRLAPGFGNNQAARLHQKLDTIREQIVAYTHTPFGYPRPEDVENDSELDNASPSAIPLIKPTNVPEPML